MKDSDLQFFGIEAIPASVIKEATEHMPDSRVLELATSAEDAYTSMIENREELIGHMKDQETAIGQAARVVEMCQKIIASKTNLDNVIQFPKGNSNVKH